LSDELDILPYLEWDFLNKPVSITKVDDNDNLPKGKKKILIERDEDYNLKAILQFEDPKFGHTSSNVAGSFSKGFQISGYSNSGLLSCVLESCHVGNIHITRNLNEGVEVKGTATLIFDGVKIRHGENNASHLIEWYVNGPKDSVFSGFTERKVERKYIRERFVSREKKVDSVNISLESFGGPTDLIWINNGNFQFLVSKVPNKIGPNWSTNIGIEYRTAWGRIPQPDERLKIEELCSFVFGRQLLSVGYTIYDQDEQLLEVSAHDPWGKAAKSFCSRPDYPPIRIRDFPSRDAERIITQLLPKYIELCEPLCLREALWNYWISCDVPVGTNLPILAAGIESIIDQWYEWKKTKSHGVYMETKEFADLLKEDIASIQKKLEGNPNKEKILSNIQRANAFGIMERYRLFFEEINLVISKPEWDAIEARHLFVHGHVRLNEMDWQKIIQHVRTLETLLNRIMLRLFEYSGSFIDRSVVGWKDAQLE
jgi:hypothetical protein